jgi:hypothetical protein
MEHIYYFVGETVVCLAAAMGILMLIVKISERRQKNK